jgi:hypothetical protein
MQTQDYLTDTNLELIHYRSLPSVTVAQCPGIWTNGCTDLLWRVSSRKGGTYTEMCDVQNANLEEILRINKTTHLKCDKQ